MILVFLSVLRIAETFQATFLTKLFAEGLVFPGLLQGHSWIVPKAGREQITVLDESVEEALLQTSLLQHEIKLGRKLIPVRYEHVPLDMRFLPFFLRGVIPLK